MIKLRIGVKHLFQESIASFKNPVPILPSNSSLKKNKHGHVLEVVPKFLQEPIDNKHIESKLSKLSSIKQKLSNISSSFFNYDDITSEKASIASLSESISNYNTNMVISRHRSDFKEFKKVLPLLTCALPYNGSVIAANTLNEEQYLNLSSDDVKLLMQDIHKHKRSYLEMMNLIPVQPLVAPAEEKNGKEKEVTRTVTGSASHNDKGNSFCNINDFSAYNIREDVTQQLGNFNLFNNNRKNVQSERNIMFQKQQPQLQQHMQGNRNENQSMRANKVVPKTFEMDPYNQQSKTNVSAYNYNNCNMQQQQQPAKPKVMMMNPYATNDDNNYSHRQQQQQQRLPYANHMNYNNNNISLQQQVNTTQAPYQAHSYSYGQQERIDFNKFKQNLLFPNEGHTRANSTQSLHNEFRRIISNINIPDTEIAKYLNECTDNVSIAAERYFQSKYNSPELTLQYVYPQNIRKTHTFSFLARVDELFSQVSMDMPGACRFKLLFQNGMELTKEMSASFRCIGALDIKSNAFIYIQPL